MKTQSLFAQLMLAVLLWGGATHAVLAAEVTDSQREAAQLKVEELRARLALTPDQEARIAPLIKERNEKLQALRASTDADASRRERRGTLKQARAIQEEFVEQIDPLLTPSQKKEWEAIRKEMRSAMIERYRNR